MVVGDERDCGGRDEVGQASAPVNGARVVRWLGWSAAIAVGIGVGFVVATAAQSPFTIGVGFAIAAVVAGVIGWKSQEWWCVASPPLVVLVPLAAALALAMGDPGFRTQGLANLLALLTLLLIPIAALMGAVAIGITAQRIEWSRWRR